MGRKKTKFDNVGRVRTTFEVNFERPEEILNVVLPLMENERLRSNILLIATETIKSLKPNDVACSTAIECVIKLLGSATVTEVQRSPIDVKFLIQAFCEFFKSLPVKDQLALYKILGEQLNTPLQEQSCEAPNLENVDLAQIINSSSKEMFERTDPRLKVFIEEAVKTSRTEAYGSSQANVKKTSFCYNIVENFLKARNLRFVSYAGLGLLTLVYIFSGRSAQVCKLVATTGAKGSYTLVTRNVLPNSKETSYKICKDGVTVYYSFDNIQKISKIWRVNDAQKEKGLVQKSTSRTIK